jgi:hypothetical protein
MPPQRRPSRDAGQGKATVAPQQQAAAKRRDSKGGAAPLSRGVTALEKTIAQATAQVAGDARKATTSGPSGAATKPGAKRGSSAGPSKPSSSAADKARPQTAPEPASDKLTLADVLVGEVRTSPPRAARARATSVASGQSIVSPSDCNRVNLVALS